MANEGEAVHGIGAGGVARLRPTGLARPPVLGEGEVDVVGDKAKHHKGIARLKNSELFFVCFRLSLMFFTC